MKSPILKVAALFGLACGAVAFSFFLFLYFKGSDALGEVRTNTDLFNSFVFMTAAIWYFRKAIRGGWLHFWEALSVGFLTNLIGALVSATLVWIFITQIDTQVLPRSIDALEQMMLKRKKEYVALVGETIFQKQLEEVRLIQPSTKFWDEVTRKVLLVGIFPLLVVAIVLRRQTYGLIHPEGETGDNAGSAVQKKE